MSKPLPDRSEWVVVDVDGYAAELGVPVTQLTDDGTAFLVGHGEHARHVDFKPLGSDLRLDSARLGNALALAALAYERARRDSA